MNKFISLLGLFCIQVSIAAPVNEQPEIKLTGSRGLVLTPKFRTSVLDSANGLTNRADEEFVASIDQVQNLYTITEDKKAGNATSEPAIVYDDATVLDVIQANFSEQIRGTLSRGDTYFLQLNGGSLLKVGQSFPASIPQVEGQSFTVTILEISTEGCTLKMNDVIQRIIFEKTSGATKDSSK